jgi:hypothetical protein
MSHFDRRLIRLVAAAVLAAVTGACSTEINSSDFDVTRKLTNLARPNWLTFSGHQDELTLPPVTEADLINRDGQCAYSGSAAGSASPSGVAAPGLMQGGISLQMTECEVVNRAGAPNNMEFGVNDRGERMVSLTFLGGPRPGIYRFDAGRLSSVERGPEAPAAPKQQRPPAKKSNRA